MPCSGNRTPEIEIDRLSFSEFPRSPTKSTSDSSKDRILSTLSKSDSVVSPLPVRLAFPLFPLFIKLTFASVPRDKASATEAVNSLFRELDSLSAYLSVQGKNLVRRSSSVAGFSLTESCAISPPTPKLPFSPSSTDSRSRSSTSRKSPPSLVSLSLDISPWSTDDSS